MSLDDAAGAYVVFEEYLRGTRFGSRGGYLRVLSRASSLWSLEGESLFGGRKLLFWGKTSDIHQSSKCQIQYDPQRPWLRLHQKTQQ